VVSRAGMRRKGWPILLGLAAVVVVAGIVYSTCGRAAPSGSPDGKPDVPSAPGRPAAAAQLVAGSPDTIRLEPGAADSLHVQTVEVRPVTEPRTLELQGSLALDTDRLVRLHSRFAGEVIEVTEVPDEAATHRAGRSVLRPISFGDAVCRGQLLAVVWCKDLGEKKSELADALSQLHLGQEQLAKMSVASRDGAISDARVRLQERNVESDLTAVARAERTLRVWRLPESEIEAVRQEARLIRERKGKRDPEKEKNWARVEVAAPLDGTILEKNVSLGDIVDTTSDLFKVANVDTLTVWANAYEENLPALLDLPPEKARWTVRLGADRELPPLPGRIEKIGYVSDPAQHTVMVMGRVENPGRRLRAGQFITATVALPPSPHEAVVPAAAMVEDGHESVVFVAPDPRQPCYALRRVAVAWRSQKEVYLRCRLTPQETARGLKPLQPGSRVVASGAIELRSALADLAAKAGQ